MKGNFARDLLIYGVSSSVPMLLGLFLVPVYTRVLSAADYGTMDLIATIVAFVAILSMLQLESAVSRYFFEEKDRRSRDVMISTATWTIVATSSVLAVTVIAFAPTISKLLFSSTDYAKVLVVAVLTIPVSNLSALYTVVIRFKKQPLHYLCFQLTQLIAATGVTLWLVVVLRIGILGVFVGQLAGYLVSALAMTAYLRGHVLLRWSGNELRRMARYSFPLVPAVAGNWVNAYANRFVMLGYLSVAEIGYYAVALKFASVFSVLGSVFRMAWGPFLWETLATDKDHRKTFRDIQHHVTMFALALAIVMALFSVQLIRVFTTTEYARSADLLGVLAVALAISSVIVQTSGMGPSIMKRTEYNTLTQFLSVAVNIAALVILVPRAGLIAVPVSLLLSSLTLWVVSWYISERCYYIGFRIYPALSITALAFVILIADSYFELTIVARSTIASSVLVAALYHDRVMFRMLAKRSST